MSINNVNVKIYRIFMHHHQTVSLELLIKERILAVVEEIKMKLTLCVLVPANLRKTLV